MVDLVNVAYMVESYTCHGVGTPGGTSSDRVDSGTTVAGRSAVGVVDILGAVDMLAEEIVSSGGYKRCL